MFIKNFPEVVEELQQYLPQYLESQGIETNKNFSCINTSHDDSNPSCSILPGNTRGYCHGCHFRFDIFDACHLLENKPREGSLFPTDTVKYLADKFGIDTVMTTEFSPEKREELEYYHIYKKVAEYITNNSYSDSASKELDRRHWPLDKAKELGIGSVQSFAEFKQFLLDQQYSEKFLEKTDLLRNDIFDKDNLIFTIHDAKGNPVGFVARNIKWKKGLNAPKYTGQNNTKNILFKKSKRLYGFHTVRELNKPIYIFEGQGDVVTARVNGINNCVAIGSTALTSDHIYLLKEYGKQKVVLCLDGDTAGQDKIEKLLDSKFSAHKEIQVSIKLIPDGQDPDEYIREHGIDAFASLAEWTAFEWRLNRFSEHEDPEDICRAMIPFIANEPSFITQENYAKLLSNFTNYSLSSIQSEVSRLQNLQKDRIISEKISILDQGITEAKSNPDAMELILSETRSKIFDISRRHNQDKISEMACLEDIDYIRKEQEEKDNKHAGFILGSDMANFQEVMNGEWDKDVLMVFGGKANAGKTAIMGKIAYEIASHQDNNALVIYHTIDDTKEQFIPRMVTVAEGTKTLEINQVKNPAYWATKDENIIEKRETGYRRLKDLVQKGRFIIKDSEHGTSLASVEMIIQYYRERFPDRQIVYFLDNFHILSDHREQKDERVRFKMLSKGVKRIATEYHIPMICTMEYTKLPMGVKPSNNNISETVSMEFDSNLIVHLYNDLHEKGPEAEIFHMTKKHNGDIQRMPRIEMIFGKNKITEFKNSLYFDFYPSSADFTGIDEQIVANDLEAIRNKKKEADEEEGTVSNGKGLFE